MFASERESRCISPDGGLAGEGGLDGRAVFDWTPDSNLQAKLQCSVLIWWCCKNVKREEWLAGCWVMGGNE